MEEKKAITIIALVLILSLLAVIFFQKVKDAVTKSRDLPSQTLEYCESRGAKYLSFSNSCMDSCELQRNPKIICAEALTTGCDCGQDMCWNGFECEKN